MAEAFSCTNGKARISSCTSDISDNETPVWSSKILCRYYLHGVCSKGPDCHYSHDLDTAQQSNVCKYYQKGQCTYGSKCRYDHVKPKNKNYSDGSETSSLIQQSKKGISCSLSQSGKRGLSSPPVPTNWSTPKPLVLPNEPKASPGFNMVKLKKGGEIVNDTHSNQDTSSKKSIDEWVKAAEFVPGQIWQGSAPTSYLNALQSGLGNLEIKESVMLPGDTTNMSQLELCPYAAHGDCSYGDSCIYFHGNNCDICGRAVLIPGDKEQNEAHQKECLAVLEEDMEESFALQRSKDKVCGICMENVLEKKPASQQRFGILSDCNHVFCLNCIRKWRQAKTFESKIIRSCPECRVKSDFVTPSKYWVEDSGEKKKLIEGYKQALSKKPCKHFDQGRGECPFNAHCFYLHAYPDGRIASPKPVRRRRREDGDGNMALLERIFLWDFLEERNNRGFATLQEDLEDIFFHLSLMHSLDSGDDTDFEFTEDEEDESEPSDFTT